MNDTMTSPSLSKEALKTIEPGDLGRSLRGFGTNILVEDALVYTNSIAPVLGVDVIRAEKAFALIAIPSENQSDDQVFISHLIQIHADFTYHNNPYREHLPENSARGLGIELHLFETDPDAVADLADVHPDWTVLQTATNKEHGVREAYLLDMYGYCWVVSEPH